MTYKNRLTVGDPPTDRGPIVGVCQDDYEALISRVAVMEAALKWYAEQALLCRLIHSEDDAGRQALSDDGGTRARRALTGKGMNND